MRIIENSHNDKVFLLPKTIDYYQEELTRMLETEQFNEAAGLLQFLLTCQSDDPETGAEWQRLLDWLQTSFDLGSNQAEDEEEEEITEDDLHKQRFYNKMSEDPNYVKKLLETVLSNPDLERKMLAIEQLIVADHPQIDDTLKRWIEQVDLHPLIQYKVLQALRARGATGKLKLRREDEAVVVEIGDTPLDLLHYAEPIQAVLERVKAVSENEQPSMVYFADQTWKEFLAYMYGSSLYTAMIDMPDKHITVWAAALHCAVVETMTGDKPRNISQLYRLDGEDEQRLAQYRELLFAFIRSTFAT